MTALIVLVCVAMYLTAAFCAGKIALSRGLERHDHNWQNCGCDARGDHWLPATGLGVIWPVYGLWHFGAWLADMILHWNERGKNQHERKIADLRRKAEIEEELLRQAHAKELAATRRATELEQANRELLEEQIGIARANRTLETAPRPVR